MSQRDRHRGVARALGPAGLQHVEPAALDGELHVLQVPEMPLQGARHPLQVGVGLGHLVLEPEIGSGVRMPETTSSPWALRRYSP